METIWSRHYRVALFDSLHLEPETVLLLHWKFWYKKKTNPKDQTDIEICFVKFQKYTEKIKYLLPKYLLCLSSAGMSFCTELKKKPK